MQVFQLAKEVGVDAKVINEFLGKSSHLANLSDEEVSQVKAQYSENKVKKDNIVVFISLKRRYSVDTPDGLIKFDKFRFPTAVGSKAYNYLAEIADVIPELYVLKGSPHKTDEERAWFRALLMKQIKDETDQVMPRFGLDFLGALYNLDEQAELKDILGRSVDEAIERVIRTKSLVRLGD